jgi:hypothetical protein
MIRLKRSVPEIRSILPTSPEERLVDLFKPVLYKGIKGLLVLTDKRVVFAEEKGFISKSYRTVFSVALTDLIQIQKASPQADHVRFGEFEVSSSDISGLVQFHNERVFPQVQMSRGLVKYKDVWVTPEEKFEREQQEKGLVKFRGEWIAPEEKCLREMVETRPVEYEGQGMTLQEKCIRVGGTSKDSAIELDKSREQAQGGFIERPIQSQGQAPLQIWEMDSESRAAILRAVESAEGRYSRAQLISDLSSSFPSWYLERVLDRLIREGRIGVRRGKGLYLPRRSMETRVGALDKGLNRCPLCGDNRSDLLMHLSVTHRIRDLDHLREEMEKKESVLRRREEFNKFVERLKERVSKGEISWNDYRKLVSKWLEER